MAASMSSLLILIPDSDPHERLLRPLHNLAILIQEVGALQGLESKVLILESRVIEDSRAHLVLVLYHNVVMLFRNHSDSFPHITGFFMWYKMLMESENFFCVSL